MSPRARAAVFVLLLAPGCRGERVFTTMSDSTFVHVMVELRKLPVGVVGDVSARAAERDSVLRRFGVTGPDLESTAVRLAREPQRAIDIWRRIEAPEGGPP